MIFYRSKFFLFRESDRCLIPWPYIFISRIKQVILEVKEQKIGMGLCCFQVVFRSICLFLKPLSGWLCPHVRGRTPLQNFMFEAIGLRTFRCKRIRILRILGKREDWQ